jgi:hypothetical protein
MLSIGPATGGGNGLNNLFFICSAILRSKIAEQPVGRKGLEGREAARRAKAPQSPVFFAKQKKCA